MFVIQSSRPHTPIKYRRLVQKRNQKTPVYLKMHLMHHNHDSQEGDQKQPLRCYANTRLNVERLS
jgi:hypothetical protein